MFELSWDRFSNPGVIAGLVIIAIGFALLCAANAINVYLTNKFDITKDCRIIIKLIAAALVFIGSLTAVFTI